MGMSQNAEVVYKSGVFKTSKSFEKVNTNADSVKIDTEDAVGILGIIVGYAMLVNTDAENVPDLVIEVTNKTLGISAEEFVIANGGGDGDAASKQSPMKYDIIRLKLTSEQKAKLTGSEFTFRAAPTITNTGGLEVVCCVVWVNFEPSADFVLEWMTQVAQGSGGAFNVNPALAIASDDTAVNLANITVISGKTMITGILVKANPNGLGDGDPIAGVVELTGGGIEPCVLPLCIFWNAGLGTVIDSDQAVLQGNYYPWRTQITNVGHTIKSKITLMTAYAGGIDTTQALLLD